MIPFVYIFSFIFKDYSSAQVVALIFNFFSGTVLAIINTLLFKFDGIRPVAKVLRWFFRIVPTFCLANGMFNIGYTEALADFDDKDEPFNALELDSAGGDILMLGVDAVVYSFILFLFELYESNPRFRNFFLVNPVKIEENFYEREEDVENEELKALNTDPLSTMVNIRKLRKVFFPSFAPAKVAVESISLNISESECFVLLGVNGAGKTTTFRMLTGEYFPTSGEIYLNGVSAISSLEKARKNIGYCPQLNPLSEFLTVEEHLKLYCEIKGIQKTVEILKESLTSLELFECKDKLAGTLSGGQKRKLCVALALLGNPSVVFLDEPSAGMDPMARKKL